MHTNTKDRFVADKTVTKAIRIASINGPRIDTQLRILQEQQPYLNIGEADALRLIFLRGLAALEGDQADTQAEAPAPAVQEKMTAQDAQEGTQNLPLMVQEVPKPKRTRKAKAASAVGIMVECHKHHDRKTRQPKVVFYPMGRECPACGNTRRGKESKARARQAQEALQAVEA
jgi:hypothetical protein